MALLTALEIPKYDFHILEYRTQGKEGEATYYLNLSNLSKKLQQQFIAERLKLEQTFINKLSALLAPIYKFVTKGVKVKKLTKRY